MPPFLRATASAMLFPLAFALGLSASQSTPTQPPPKELPTSLDRIREELTETSPKRLKLDMPVDAPVATFKTGVDQKVYVITFKEWLHQELELGVLQRQSADWAAKCCGIGLEPIFKSIDQALERRKVRKIREQIARELADLEVARKAKAGAPDER